MLRLLGLAALCIYAQFATASNQVGVEHAPGAALDHTHSNTYLTLASNGNKKRLPPDSIESASDSQQKGLLRIYRSNLLKKTYKHIMYPDSAIERNQEGDVILRITIDRTGEVHDIKYDLRSEFNSLNKAALSAIEDAQPFPVVPIRIKGERFELLMPIRFRLTG